MTQNQVVTSSSILGNHALSHALGRVTSVPLSSGSNEDPEHYYGGLIVAPFADNVKFHAGVTKAWDGEKNEWREMQPDEQQLMLGKYVWFSATQSLKEAHCWWASSVTWIPGASESFHEALVAYPVGEDELSTKEKETLKRKLPEPHPVVHGMAVVSQHNGPVVVIEIIGTGLTAKFAKSCIFLHDVDVGEQLVAALQPKDPLEVWVRPLYAVAEDANTNMHLSWEHPWKVTMIRLPPKLTETIILRNLQTMELQDGDVCDKESSSRNSSPMSSNFDIPCEKVSGKIVTATKRKLRVQLGEEIKCFGKSQVTICGLPAEGLILQELLKPNDTVFFESKEGEEKIYVEPMQEYNSQDDIQKLQMWCQSRNVGDKVAKKLEDRAMTVLHDNERQISSAKAEFEKLLEETSHTICTIKQLEERNITLQPHGMKMLISLPIETLRAFLFGISLEKLNLAAVYRPGQELFVYQDYWQTYEVHLGQKKESKLKKRLDNYFKRYQVDPTIQTELKERADMMMNDGNSFTITTADLMNCIFASPPVDCTFDNQLGTIVDVQTKYGIVRVGQVQLKFNPHNVHLYAVPLGQFDMAMFLKPEQKVYVSAKQGHVTGLWVGTNRQVSSLNSIEEMKRFYERRGVDQKLMDCLEFEMKKLYCIYNGIDMSLNLTNELTTVDEIEKAKGVIKGKNNKWNVTFNTHHVHLFAVSLEGVEDLTLFLKKGQKVFLDVEAGLCKAVWIGTQRTMYMEGTPVAVTDYCMNRSMPPDVIKMLISRFREAQVEQPDPSLPQITKATLANVKPGGGHLMFQDQLLQFTSSQILLFGYSLGGLDLSKVLTTGLSVSASFTNSILQKVWVGSPAKSRPDLQTWIETHVMQEETKQMLVKHWGLIFKKEEKAPKELESPEIDLEKQDEDIFGDWAPIADPEEEKIVMIAHADSLHSSHLASQDSEDVALAEPVCEDQATIQNEVVASLENEDTVCELPPEERESSDEQTSCQQSLEERLACFLLDKELVDDAERARQLSALFFHNLGDCVSDAWPTRAGRDDETDSVTMSDLTLVGCQSGAPDSLQSELGSELSEASQCSEPAEEMESKMQSKMQEALDISEMVLQKQAEIQAIVDNLHHVTEYMRESCLVYDNINSNSNCLQEMEKVAPRNKEIDLCMTESNVDCEETFDESKHDEIAGTDDQETPSVCQKCKAVRSTIACQTVSTGKIIHKHLYLGD